MGPESTFAGAWGREGGRSTEGAKRAPAASGGAVSVLDLLRCPFVAGGDDPREGLDCWGQAAEVARRLGRRLPVPGRSLDGLRLVGATWRAATELGDLVGSDLEGRGYPTHVSVLIDTKRRLVLSCAEGRGAFVVPVWTVRDVVGVWRAAR